MARGGIQVDEGDVLTDPRFAGLHWSIDRDTPIEDRSKAHYFAAWAAYYMREALRVKAHMRVHPCPEPIYDPFTCTYVCCGMTELEEAMRG